MKNLAKNTSFATASKKELTSLGALLRAEMIVRFSTAERKFSKIARQLAYLEGQPSFLDERIARLKAELTEAKGDLSQGLDVHRREIRSLEKRLSKIEAKLQK